MHATPATAQVCMLVPPSMRACVRVETHERIGATLSTASPHKDAQPQQTHWQVAHRKQAVHVPTLQPHHITAHHSGALAESADGPWQLAPRQGLFPPPSLLNAPRGSHRINCVVVVCSSNECIPGCKDACSEQEVRRKGDASLKPITSDHQEEQVVKACQACYKLTTALNNNGPRRNYDTGGR